MQCPARTSWNRTRILTRYQRKKAARVPLTDVKRTTLCTKGWGPFAVHMAGLLTGPHASWPYHVDVIRTSATEHEVHVSMTKRHSYFRGVEELPHDINYMIHDLLTTRLQFVLSVRGRLHREKCNPFVPYQWQLRSFCCNQGDLPIQKCLESAIERENKLLREQWTPLFAAGHHLIVTILSRIQTDVGSILSDNV